MSTKHRLDWRVMMDWTRSMLNPFWWPWHRNNTCGSSTRNNDMDTREFVFTLEMDSNVWAIQSLLAIKFTLTLPMNVLALQKAIATRGLWVIVISTTRIAQLPWPRRTNTTTAQSRQQAPTMKPPTTREGALLLDICCCFSSYQPWPCSGSDAVDIVGCTFHNKKQPLASRMALDFATKWKIITVTMVMMARRTRTSFWQATMRG
mmetsp:Transcript_7859/g.21914  ORF Transcript_7859/g.21914 Transcript_7859/m.21914 type:complete len:205 (-) Transcript_7859:848-1462(-)